MSNDLASVNSTLCYSNEGAHEAVLLAPNLNEVECNIRTGSLDTPQHCATESIDPELYSEPMAQLEQTSAGPDGLRAVLDEATSHYVLRVPLNAGLQVVRFHTRIPIEPDSDNRFRLRSAVPLGPVPLREKVPVSVTVLLPLDTPDYRVNVLDWSREARVPEDSSALVGLMGRRALTWHWHWEPFLSLDYRYESPS
jgi:hypothetical protein